MPSKYWEDSADLSCDSSAESSQDSGDSPNEMEDSRSTEEIAPPGAAVDGFSNWETDPTDLNANVVEQESAVSRGMTTNFQLPSLQPHQHASLFYLSLIEGRCRTQAVASINAGRAPEERVAEDHPEVSNLAKHLFSEMSKELINAGMMPEEFASRPLPELRLYLSSFDSILKGIALTRAPDLSETGPYRAIDSNRDRGRGSVVTLASAENSLEEIQPTSKTKSNLRTHGPWFSSSSEESPQNIVATTRHNPSNRPFSTTPFNSAPKSSLHESPYEAAAASNYLSLHQSPYEPAASNNYLSFHQSAQSSLEGSQSQALVLHNQKFAMARQLSPGPAARLHSLMYPEHIQTGNSSVPESVFGSQYSEKIVIGKGGFGRVYKVRYNLDKAEYAIKKIVISASQVRKLVKHGRLADLPKEAQALANLNHPHIVRYHHSWVETRLASSKHKRRRSSASGSGSNSDEPSPTSSLDDPTPTINSPTEAIESMSLDNSALLDKEFGKRSRNTTIHEAGDSHILFGADSTSASPHTGSRNAAGHPSEPERDRTLVEDDDTEDDEREDNHVAEDDEEEVSNDAEDDEQDDSNDAEHDGQDDSNDADDDEQEKISDDEELSASPAPEKQVSLSVAHPTIDFDVLLYIKMTSYPLSLADYIQQEKHCFHALPTIRLLRKLLAGVTYLHRKNIVHRDLKPGNIFLSFPEKEEEGSPGNIFVDVGSCNECDCEGKQERWISPCIGDFGLVADLKDTTSTPHYVGTRLYRPAITCPPCPKLDMYALGMIAFELLHKFGTSTERMLTLEKLRNGVFPPSWAEDEDGEEGEVVRLLREGIRGMLHRKRDARWGSGEVAKWLERLEKVLVGQAAEN